MSFPIYWWYLQLYPIIYLISDNVSLSIYIYYILYICTYNTPIYIYPSIYIYIHIWYHMISLKISPWKLPRFVHPFVSSQVDSSSLCAPGDAPGVTAHTAGANVRNSAATNHGKGWVNDEETWIKHGKRIWIARLCVLYTFIYTAYISIFGISWIHNVNNTYGVYV